MKYTVEKINGRTCIIIYIKCGNGPTYKNIARPSARLNLDKHLIEGTECIAKKDLTKAKICYKLSTNYAVSYNNLAIIYMIEGKNIKSHEYYLKAIRMGSKSAIYNLGLYHEKQNDVESMMKYYEDAIKIGDHYAMNNLGYHYERKNNYKLMIKYYQMAIESGNSVSMHNLAFYYHNKNETTIALKYYLMAADMDNVRSIHVLAGYHKHKENFDTMVKYYLMAIDLAYAPSMHALAVYYERQSEYDLAIKYYQMATKLGKSISMHALGTHYQRLHNYTLATKYYLMTIELGKTYSLIDLGHCYEQQEDHVSALTYYLLAIESNETRTRGIRQLNRYLERYSTKQLLVKHKQYLNSRNLAKLDSMYFEYLKTYEKNVGECDICFDDRPIVKLKCNHGICKDCYTQIKLRRELNLCPFCRGSFEFVDESFC